MAINEEAERPQKVRRPFDRLNVLTGDWWNLIDTALVAIIDIEETATTEEALNDVNSKLWREAIQSEYDSLKRNKTRDLVELPTGKNIAESKWVFKHKRGTDGQIQRCKACIVARGTLKNLVLTTMKFFHLWQSIAQFVLS